MKGGRGSWGTIGLLQFQKDAVQTMLDTAKGRIKVKPSGGIRSYEDAIKYVNMGAARLGVGTTGTANIMAGQKAALENK